MSLFAAYGRLQQLHERDDVGEILIVEKQEASADHQEEVSVMHRERFKCLGVIFMLMVASASIRVTP
jgi:hypothetical protein